MKRSNEDDADIKHSNDDSEDYRMISHVMEIYISYCRNLYVIRQLDYYNSKVESAAVL